MTSENILVSTIAIIASLAILVGVALVTDYRKRIWHHLTGGVYMPAEEVASGIILPAGVATAAGMILVLGMIAVIQPFDLAKAAEDEAVALATRLVTTPAAVVEEEHGTETGEATEAGTMTRADGIAMLKSKGCLVCHAFGDEGFLSGPGPQLEGLSGRNQIAGTMDLNADNLKKWLANPPAVKPGTIMPNLALSAAEIDKFADFLMHN